MEVWIQVESTDLNVQGNLAISPSCDSWFQLESCHTYETTVSSRILDFELYIHTHKAQYTFIDISDL